MITVMRMASKQQIHCKVIGLRLIVTLSVIMASGQISTGQNLTLRKGSPQAVFNCSGNGTAGEAVSWSTEYQKLFASPSTLYADKSKYSVSAVNITNGVSYILTVINVTLADGGTYVCEKTFQLKWDRLYFNLVVVESPTAVVQRLPSGIHVHDIVLMSCAVNYGAPSTLAIIASPLDPKQDPQLRVTFGSTELTPHPPDVVFQGGFSYTKTIRVNYTVAEGDDGKNLGCEVYTNSPIYSDSASAMLRLNTPLTAVSITPSDATINLGNSYFCQADGYPLSTIVWTPLWNNLTVSDGSSGIGNASLAPSKVGQHYWNCTALNPLYKTLSQAIAFTAVQDANISSLASHQSDNFLGLVIGLGIGLGVPIAVGIIVLIVVLLKRRTTSDEKKTSPPVFSDTSDTSYRPTSSDVVRPVRLVLDKTPPTSVDPSPNPASAYKNNNSLAGQGRIMHARDSPGYGDLGLRHMNGSGGTPRLNTNGSTPQLDDFFDGGVSNSLNDNNPKLSTPEASDNISEQAAKLTNKSRFGSSEV